MTIFQYTIKRCIGNTIYNLLSFSRVVPICATNIITKYIIVWLSYKFDPRNCKGYHLSSYYMNIDDESKFKYSIQRFIGNTIYTLAPFARIVPFCNSNTTALYKIVWLSLKFHLQNCKGNHMSLYINIYDGIIFYYSTLGCIGNQSIV